MAKPARGTDTATDRLELTWTLLSSPDDGYSVVTTYALYWDAGNDGASFTDLVGEASDYMVDSYLVTAGVTAGESY